MRRNKWLVFAPERSLPSCVASRPSVLGNLPRGTQPDYLTLVKALEERFSPPSQTDLYGVQFRERRQRAGETLPELGQAMNRLVHMAFPSAPEEVKETLATDQFINALVDSDVRIRI